MGGIQRTLKPWSTATLERIPELRHLPPDDHFMQTWRQNRSGSIILAWAAGFTWLIFFPVMAAFVVPVAYAFITNFTAQWVVWGVTMLLWSMCIFGPVFCTIRSAPRFRREQFRKELRRRGLAVCAMCGYDINDTVISRCPECGAAS